MPSKINELCEGHNIITCTKASVKNRHKREERQKQGHLIPLLSLHWAVENGDRRNVCARQDNTQGWRRVIEISIKEVISGVIAEVLWFVFVCERRLEEERETVDVLRICHLSLRSEYHIRSSASDASAPRLLFTTTTWYLAAVRGARPVICRYFWLILNLVLGR